MEIITASKKTIPVKLTKSPDGKTILADFVPTELGENQLTVKVNSSCKYKAVLFGEERREKKSLVLLGEGTVFATELS